MQLALYANQRTTVTYGISMNSSINPFARVMNITSKEVAYVIPF